MTKETNDGTSPVYVSDYQDKTLPRRVAEFVGVEGGVPAGAEFKLFLSGDREIMKTLQPYEILPIGDNECTNWRITRITAFNVEFANGAILPKGESLYLYRKV